MYALLPLFIVMLGSLVGGWGIHSLTKVDALLLKCSKPVTRGLCGWNDRVYYE